VLRRCVPGGILRISFGLRPSMGCHGWARSARDVVPRDLNGFGELRRVRSNISFERTRSTSSAKLRRRRARRSTQSLGAMTNRKLACLLLVGAFALPAGGRDFCAKPTVFSTTTPEGISMGLVIAREDFAASPTWQPGKGEVPLSAAKALEIAVRATKPSVSKVDATALESVTLSSHSCNLGPRHWYYIINFETQGVDADEPAPSITIGVLLSGKVVHMSPLTDGT
jgi:hypothetical protein